ncbi:hypothetical protein FHT78_000085 [Rhizobium sp. BK196]|jgi:hypothetical protein|uniref:DUF5677 domain-containing protein n=1 Tax=Rhizobium sp. BK196 TaxID=2587073 RepID=UPI00161C5EC3|nr:DUF5677 domain-containing protein [Rhizobium sp. BK196]MBB3308356.1 hypothetical protein [Rhizobium sp. BK196]
MAKNGNVRKENFKNLNISPLDKLKRRKGKILDTFSGAGLGAINHPASWIDECVPNILWAVLVVSSIDRMEYLDVFRRLIENCFENLPKRKELHITHNFLSVASEDEFDVMMKPILADKRLHETLSTLLAIETLPDRKHWERHLKLGDKGAALRQLAAAIADVFDHQSEKSTDIRWLKTLYVVCCRDQLTFDISLKDKIKEIVDFPNFGQQEQVRPSIRALELGLRQIEFQLEDAEKHWPAGRQKMAIYNSEAFWQQMFNDAPCLVLSEYPSQETAPADVLEEISRLADVVSDHYMKTITTTKADPRHEAAFGLALYAIQLALISGSLGHSQTDGRVTLRTIVETFILLRYLTQEDNETLWLQYRKYGAGQTKLAFLKYMKQENLPDFIDLAELHRIANEDRWMEFQDIDLGHWAGANLRKMAELAAVKDVYDKYYDWTSGFVHGQWASTRSTVFVNCLNPLHRYHVVPSSSVLQMPSVLPDACKLINRMIDDLNSLYPTLKMRLSAYKVMTEPEPNEKIQVVAVK